MAREKYKKTQAERVQELDQERKLMTPNKKKHTYGSDSEPRREKSSKLLKKTKKY